MYRPLNLDCLISTGSITIILAVRIVLGAAAQLCGLNAATISPNLHKSVFDTIQRCYIENMYREYVPRKTSLFRADFEPGRLCFSRMQITVSFLLPFGTQCDVSKTVLCSAGCLNLQSVGMLSGFLLATSCPLKCLFKFIVAFCCFLTLSKETIFILENLLLRMLSLCVENIWSSY